MLNEISKVFPNLLDEPDQLNDVNCIFDNSGYSGES